MKIILKYSNHFGFVLALCAMVICGCSCITSKPDPLAGWQKDFGQTDPTITKDYQDYIQKLPSDGKKYAHAFGYYDDGKGKHAILIEVDLNGTAWNHVLFYDKDNKRIKVIKYAGWRYMS
jgi:hypothetical protein